MKKIEIDMGTMFGDLKYIDEAGHRALPSGQKPRTVLCECICGNTLEILFLHLYRGRIKSCKCKLDRESALDRGTRLHNVWRSMIWRTKPYATKKSKKSYYNKGIDVCTEWLVYSVFKQWAFLNGFAEGLQIDRINNSEGYSPENCRFVTSWVNMANRDVTIFVDYKGRKVPFMDLAREFNFDKTRTSTTLNRINRGWNAEKAFETSVREGKYARGDNHYSAKKIKNTELKLKK